MIVKKTVITGIGLLTLIFSSLFFWDAAAVTREDPDAATPSPAVAPAVATKHAPLPDVGGPARQAQIARGLYLARAGDCVACHTAVGGAAFAGGMPLATPFGTIVASNITPDRETGIGAWSRDEFRRAVRAGVGRHGQYLYPAMPYTAYAKLKDQDVDDIKAYLDTVTPVRQKVVSNQLPFPFNIRLMMFGWNLLFFDRTPFTVDDSQSVEWNRGAYLVEGLGHCAACHTAKNFLGGDKALLQGGTLQGWYAPEITGNANTGIGRWSNGEIAAYLKTGGNAHSVASGPMAEAVTNSTQYLGEADLRAIAAYLKSLPGSTASAATALAPDAPAMRAGRAVFLNNCAACHGSRGAGVPGMVAALAASPGLHADNPANLLRAMLIGGRGAITAANPTGAAMPSFGWKLSDAEMADVATYVRNSWGNAAPEVDADAVKAARAALGAQAWR